MALRAPLLVAAANAIETQPTYHQALEQEQFMPVNQPPMDPRFRVDLIAATPNVQQCIYAALHQDYGEEYVFDEMCTGLLHIGWWPDESRSGEIIVKRLLAGDRAHYGPLEHGQIMLNVGWFPHSVMQQARTHRVGVSFDAQSFRYSGSRIVDCVEGRRDFEDVFYLRPLGHYSDRQGKKYCYKPHQRAADKEICMAAALRYAKLIHDGFAEEHARSILPFDVRQHFVVSFNLRAFLHFLDLRAKLDAQDEIRQLCDLMWPHLQAWAPEIAAWYHQHRWAKARLAP